MPSLSDISPISQIYRTAGQLALSASNPIDLGQIDASQSFTVLLRGLHDHLTLFMGQARELDVDIRDLSNLNSSLDRALQDPGSSNRENLAQLLSRISQAAFSILQHSPSAAEGPVPIDVDEEMDELVEDQRRYSERDHIDIEQRRKNRICAQQHPYLLQITDEMLTELKKFPDWKNAIEMRDSSLFDNIPLFFEAFLIQKSASYQEYITTFPKRKTFLSKEKYEEIRGKFPLEEILANKFGPNLELNQQNADLIQLKSFGKEIAKEYEQFLSLGIQHNEELERQKELSGKIGTISDKDLQAEIQKAMKAEEEVMVFPQVLLQAVLESQSHRLSKETVEKLTIWLAAHGRSSLLRPLLEHHKSQISRDTFFKAFRSSFKMHRNTTCNLLFSHYPHDQRGAPKALLLAFAKMGFADGLSHLLSQKYQHGFAVQTIDEAFRAVMEQEDTYDCISLFFLAQVSPFDETLSDAFQKLCKTDEWQSLIFFLIDQISRDCLTKILLQAFNEKQVPIQVVQTILAKRGDLDTVKIFKAVVQRPAPNTDKKSLLQILIKNSPQLTSSEIEELFSFCEQRHNLNAGLIAVQHPNALGIQPAVLAAVLRHAAARNWIELINRPFLNLKNIQNPFFEEILYIALYKNHIAAAYLINQNRQLNTVSFPNSLKQVVRFAASIGEAGLLNHIYTIFNGHINDQISREAKDIAANFNHTAAVAYLTEKLGAFTNS